MLTRVHFALFLGQDIRFKVTDEAFVDTTPIGPGIDSGENVAKDSKHISYRITVNCQLLYFNV